MSNKLRLLTTITVILFFLLALYTVFGQYREANMKEIEQRKTTTELQKLNTESQKLETEVENLKTEKITDEVKLKELETEKVRLEAEKIQLEKDLQAKKETKSKIATAVANTVSTPAVVATPKVHGGNCSSWLASAGIPETYAVTELIRRESGCNPNAVNPSSGACGIGQQLPCGKWAGEWNDPIAGLHGMNGYVMSRYGSWESALAWHDAHNWY